MFPPNRLAPAVLPAVAFHQLPTNLIQRVTLEPLVVLLHPPVKLAALHADVDRCAHPADRVPQYLDPLPALASIHGSTHRGRTLGRIFAMPMPYTLRSFPFFATSSHFFQKVSVPG